MAVKTTRQDVDQALGFMRGLEVYMPSDPYEKRGFIYTKELLQKLHEELPVPKDKKSFKVKFKETTPAKKPKVARKVKKKCPKKTGRKPRKSSFKG
jgi:ABC-type oligopeptide transport system ATPase subunit